MKSICKSVGIIVCTFIMLAGCKVSEIDMTTTNQPHESTATPKPVSTIEPTPTESIPINALEKTSFVKQIRNSFAIVKKQGLQQLGEFVDSVAVAKKGGRYGLIDDKGAWILEPTYTEIGDFHEGIAKARVGDKWGYININGEVIVEPEYQYANDFHYSLACVGWNDRQYYIDKSGEIVLDSKDYDRYVFDGDFDEDGTVCVTNIEEKNGDRYHYCGVIDKAGNVVIDAYELDLEFVSSSKNGYRVAESNKDNSNPFNAGVIDEKGNWIINPKYETIEFRGDNMAVVTNDDGSGIITLAGDWVIESDGTMFFDMGDNTLVRYTLKAPQKMELFDMEGNILLGGKSYQSINIISDNLVVCSKNDSDPYHLYSHTGMAYLPNYGISYWYMLNDDIVALHAYVGEECLWGVLDVNKPDEWIVKPQYNSIIKFKDGFGYAELPDGKHEVFDVEGNTLIIGY